MLKSQLGLRVESLMKKQNLNKKQVAERVGVTYQIISKIIAGRIKSPRGNTLHKLCKTLDTTPEYLMDGIGLPNIQKYNKIPILSLKDTYSWCKNDSKKMSGDFHEYIVNPLEINDQNYFAVKILSDAMEGNGGNGIPKGCIAICRPNNELSTNKFIVFYDKERKGTFMREAVIEEKTYLKPLNPHYEIKENNNENIIPIAEVIATLNLLEHIS